MASLDRAVSHRTADDHAVKIGNVVFIRHGGEYPRPGLWRVRAMRVVEFVGAAKVRLEALNPCKTLNAVRASSELYRDRLYANGSRRLFDNPLA